MSKRMALVALLLPLAAGLAACGDAPETTTTDATGANTLYVKAAGMVKKLGIT